MDTKLPFILKNAYALYNFRGDSLTSVVLVVVTSSLYLLFDRFDSDCRIERVVVMGLDRGPKKISLESTDGARELTFDFDANTKTLTIRSCSCH